uniref:PUB domain-containing protein n=1 Tax=Babesia bovis TaxID=5865 RepID=S6B8K7_BABBO|nr:hypothetical protein [Babesia bovis]
MTKLSDTVDQIENLKKYVEHFLATNDDELIGMYSEYQVFKKLLSSLLPVVGKYRLELNVPDDKVIFGPKTRQIVEQLIRHYDKVYEIDEEVLSSRFLEVEQVHDILAREAQDSGEEAEVRGMSIIEETKEDLKRIERAKEVSKVVLPPADFSNIQDSDREVNDPFYIVQQVYKTEPAVVLEKVVAQLHEDNPDGFLQIMENVANLISQIARHPDNTTLRVLRITNEKLYQDFIQYPKAIALLKYARFKLKHGNDLREVLEQLAIGNMKDEYFLYLHEPDMFNDYRSWKEWIDFIETTNRTLEELIVQYKSVLRRRKVNDRNTLEEALLQAGCARPSNQSAVT